MPAQRRTQRTGSMLMSLLRAPDLALWAMVLVLMPIYVWQSGRPQPADLLSLAFIPLIARESPRPVAASLPQTRSNGAVRIRRVRGDG